MHVSLIPLIYREPETLFRSVDYIRWKNVIYCLFQNIFGFISFYFCFLRETQRKFNQSMVQKRDPPLQGDGHAQFIHLHQQ